MSRSIQYNSNLALIGPSPSDSNHIDRMRYLNLMQGANVSISQPSSDVIGIGSKKQISRQYFPPQLRGSFNYILSNGVNEKLFGFTVEDESDFLSGERTSFSNGLNSCGGINDEDERFFNNHNLFILTEKNGNDAIEVDDSKLEDFSVFAMGNCYVDSYSISCGVNQIPTASVGFSAETFYLADYVPHETGASGEFISAMSVPAITQASGLPSSHKFTLQDDIYRSESYGQPLPVGETRSGVPTPNLMEVYLSGQSVGVLSGSNHENTFLQSFSMNLPIPRRDQRSLKSKYNHDKPFSYPLEGSIDLSIIVDDFVEGDARLFEQDDFDIHLKFKGKVFDGSTRYTEEYLNMFIRGAKVSSQSFSHSSSRMTWNANLSFLEGESTDSFDRTHHSGVNGLFMSGLKDLSAPYMSSIDVMNNASIISDGSWICQDFNTQINML